MNQGYAPRSKLRQRSSLRSRLSPRAKLRGMYPCLLRLARINNVRSHFARRRRASRDRSDIIDLSLRLAIKRRECRGSGRNLDKKRKLWHTIIGSLVSCIIRGTAPKSLGHYDPLVTLIVNNKLFVGSLPWGVDDAQLSEMFSAHGSVVSARVITDRETGRSRGFGFVEFADEATAQAAMEALDGSMIEGRAISVSFARPKAE